MKHYLGKLNHMSIRRKLMMMSLFGILVPLLVLVVMLLLFAYKGKTEAQLPVVGVTAVVLTALSVWTAHGFGRNISRRLQRLVRVMDSYKNEEVQEIEESQAEDEIGRTERRYNHLAQRINQLLFDKDENVAELEAMNQELVDVYQNLESSYDEIQKQNDRINDLIYLDSLTGLKNKYAVDLLIEEKLKSNQEAHPLAVAFIDIDNFKFINDTYGHDVGDEIIRETGLKIESVISDSIHVGRFGGDEFLMLIEKTEDLDELLASIKDLFRKPIQYASNTFYLTVSIGVSMYPEHAKTKNDLIKKADLALYEAKNSGRNRVVVFKPDMSSAVDEMNGFRRILKEGFQNGEFYLNYQPYYSVRTKQVEGYEALIRWNSPVLGQVSPFKMITNAEQMGMIIELGDWIFREACLFSKQLSEAYFSSRTVSINISAVQIMDDKFIERIGKIVDELDVDTSRICLEMTETIMIKSLEHGSSILAQLKEMGFKIALDDFGTGYSSLSYIKELPLDIMKIDKAFIDGIVHKAYDRDLTEIMIAIAHKRDLKVTAEGVEYKEQFEMLDDFDCDTVQGYYFSEALSPETILNIPSQAKEATINS